MHNNDGKTLSKDTALVLPIETFICNWCHILNIYFQVSVAVQISRQNWNECENDKKNPCQIAAFWGRCQNFPPKTQNSTNSNNFINFKFSRQNCICKHAPNTR